MSQLRCPCSCGAGAWARGSAGPPGLLLTPWPSRSAVAGCGVGGRCALPPVDREAVVGTWHQAAQKPAPSAESSDNLRVSVSAQRGCLGAAEHLCPSLEALPAAGRPPPLLPPSLGCEVLGWGGLSFQPNLVTRAYHRPLRWPTPRCQVQGLAFGGSEPAPSTDSVTHWRLGAPRPGPATGRRRLSGHSPLLPQTGRRPRAAPLSVGLEHGSLRRAAC